MKVSVLVVGSVALDYLETPYGKLEQALGGSATFVSIAASYFSRDTRFVGIVGGDFPEEHIEYFKSRGIHTDGLEIVKEGKTFSWGGKYHDDMNTRDTLYTELGVFEHFNPTIPEQWKESDYVLLGNIHPDLQRSVLEQAVNPKLSVCDTMNLWINISYDSLVETISKVDVLVLNDEEAKMLTRELNLIAAGRKMLGMGPSVVVIKKGEHGAMLMTEDNLYVAPAMPLALVKDPTGAGDSFAGGFIGWLAKTDDLSFENMKRAVIYGSVMASFCVEEFSIASIRDLNEEQIQNRAASLVQLSACSL
jgi:sugar/nucleoside kinase (ribokinase family)